MRLIIGLGNPGPDYASTRHNIGFLAVDKLAEQLHSDWKVWCQSRNCELIQSTIKGDKVLLAKPLTYMNNSGQAAVAVAHFFKVLPDEICVLHDDMDLPFGDVRLKIGGGDGGHNGLKSLTKSLSSPAYARVRLGIGRPPKFESQPGVQAAQMDPVDYVLGSFSGSDWATVDDMIERALRAVEAFASGPDAFTREMNTLNKRTSHGL